MTREVSANGVRFSCLEEGGGPLVLLFHGFPDTAHTWDLVRPKLAEAGFRAVSPFMRGYAPTQVPPDGRYDGETLALDVLALIDALGEKRAIVVGHDWGALASYGAAALGPDKVSRLVTVGVPHPRSVGRPTAKLLWAMRHFVVLNLPGSVSRARANDFAQIDQLVQRWSPKWTVPKGETDAVKECFRQPGSLEAALGYYWALSPFLPKWTQRPIAVPAISFAGLDDTFEPGVYESARRCYSGEYEVVTMPGGHFMHREHPERFTRELLQRLRE